MDDFMVDPEVITNCKTEIATQCAGGLQREGKTLHCLMKMAKKQGGKDGPMSKDCEKAVSDYSTLSHTQVFLPGPHEADPPPPSHYLTPPQYLTLTTPNPSKSSKGHFFGKKIQQC